MVRKGNDPRFKLGFCLEGVQAMQVVGFVEDQGHRKGGTVERFDGDLQDIPGKPRQHPCIIGCIIGVIPWRTSGSN